MTYGAHATGGSQLRVFHNQLWLLQTSRSALPEEGPRVQSDNSLICLGHTLTLPPEL